VSLSTLVKRVVPISPLADLEPISLTAMNADLRLDPAEIGGESPARLSLRPAVQSHVWVGAQERPAFLWQARLLSEAWSCPWTPESGKHHFDVIDGLTDPASALLSVCLD
jgi:arylformamidase